MKEAPRPYQAKHTHYVYVTHAICIRIALTRAGGFIMVNEFLHSQVVMRVHPELFPKVFHDPFDGTKIGKKVLLSKN